MKCPRRQQENPPQAKFCLECATPLALRCASCGTQLPPTAKFCFECAKPTSKAAMEGERKLVAVLFADVKGSTELLADRDPKETRKLLDPVLEHMMVWNLIRDFADVSAWARVGWCVSREAA